MVRVTSIDRDGASLGSGVLVAVNQTHGLVLTNWHVVRETSGQILVSFPDGFTSGATVLKTDSTWDLAALAIWRPNVQPVRLSIAASRPGEVLTIAGYGRDSTYRAVSGRCAEYLSPGGNHPNELMEVGDVAARNGDSGGPIFNTRGELAGVLFGSNDSFLAGRYTMGSYCGRVRVFVASVSGDFQRLPANPTMVARQGRPIAAGGATGGHCDARDSDAFRPNPSSGRLPDSAARGGGIRRRPHRRCRLAPAGGGGRAAASVQSGGADQDVSGGHRHFRPALPRDSPDWGGGWVSSPACFLASRGPEPGA